MNVLMTENEMKKLVRMVRAQCPDQALAEGTVESWSVTLATKMTFAEAVEVLYVFTASDSFRNMRFRQITPADLLEMRRLMRRERGKHGWTARLDADPDDAVAYIEALRASNASAGSGVAGHPGGGSKTALEATERRRRALAAGGATYMDREAQRGARAAMPPEARAALDAVRSGCGPGAPRERTPTLEPATGGGSEGMARLSAAAVEALPELASAAGGGDPYGEVAWCGQCNKQTRRKTAVVDDELVAVDCCTGTGGQ